MTVDVLLNSDRSIIRLGHTCAEESDATTGAESKRNFFSCQTFLCYFLLLLRAVHEFLPRDVMHPR